jgi:hypothetical protein
MEEEKNKNASQVKVKKGKKRFNRIPPEILFSPAGMVLLFMAVVTEAMDLMIPGSTFGIKLITDLFFVFFLMVVARSSFKSIILPFLIERIPLLSDLIPTWIVKMIFF